LGPEWAHIWIHDGAIIFIKQSVERGIHVPTTLKLRLADWVRTWLSSEISENGFRVLSKASKASESAQLSRDMRFSKLIESTVMDEHRRDRVLITPAARKAGMGIAVGSQEQYMATHSHADDMPLSYYEKITDDPEAYPHLIPLDFHTGGLRWEAYLQAGSYAALSERWHSLMMQPTWLVRHVGHHITGVVIK
jgi:hypothetical protein